MNGFSNSRWVCVQFEHVFQLCVCVCLFSADYWGKPGRQQQQQQQKCVWVCIQAIQAKITCDANDHFITSSLWVLICAPMTAIFTPFFLPIFFLGWLLWKQGSTFELFLFRLQMMSCAAKPSGVVFLVVPFAAKFFFFFNNQIILHSTFKWPVGSLAAAAVSFTSALLTEFALDWNGNVCEDEYFYSTTLWHQQRETVQCTNLLHTLADWQCFD